MSDEKKTWAALALILLLCLTLRLGYVAWLLQEPRPIVGDGYPEIAQNILAGKGFSPTPLREYSIRTPGYPLFIAAVWSIVPLGARYVALLAAQAILSVAGCGLLFTIANAVFGRRAALAGAFLFALSPSNIVHCAQPISESLNLVWIALAVLLAMRLYRSGRYATAIGLGLIWGVAGLTRPEATLIFLPLFLPILVATHLTIATRFSVCATAVLTKIAVMAPWVARNFVVYGAFVLHVPLAGFNLFYGTYPYPPRLGARGVETEPAVITRTREYQEITEPFWDPEYRPQAPGRAQRMERDAVEGMPMSRPDGAIVVVRSERDMLEVDRRLAAAALNNIKNHKLIQLYNIPRHIYALWGRPAGWWGHWGVDLPSWLEIVWHGCHLAFLALFVLGVVVAWKSGKLGVVPLSWLILMAVHTGVLLVFAAEARYQATSAIFLYTFSGLGAATVLPFRAVGARTAAGSGAVVAQRAGSGS